MERFSADYIRQQPEYRYMVYKDTAHVIQTCVEDGEIKLKFGHPPTPATDHTVRLPHHPNRQTSVRSGSSSAASRSIVYHLTSVRGHSSSAANTSFSNKSNQEIPDQRQVEGHNFKTTDAASADNSTQAALNQRQAGDNTSPYTQSEGRNVQKHGVSSTDDAANSHTENKNHSGKEERQYMNEESNHIHSGTGAMQSAGTGKTNAESNAEGYAESSLNIRNRDAIIFRHSGRSAGHSINAQSDPDSETNSKNTESKSNAGIITGPSADPQFTTNDHKHDILTVLLPPRNDQKSVDDNTEGPNNDASPDHTISVAGQSINRGNNSVQVKTEGITISSANKESRCLTEQKGVSDSAEITRNKMSNGESCGGTETVTNSHDVHAERNTDPDTAAPSIDSHLNQNFQTQDNCIQQDWQRYSDACERENGIDSNTHRQAASCFFRSSTEITTLVERFADMENDSHRVSYVHKMGSGCEDTDMTPEAHSIHEKGNTDEAPGIELHDVQEKKRTHCGNLDMKRNRKTKVQGKSPRASKSAGKRPLKGNGDGRSRSPRNKIQSLKKKQESITTTASFYMSKNKISQTSHLNRRKENEPVSQQNQREDFQSKTQNWGQGATSAPKSVKCALLLSDNQTYIKTEGNSSSQQQYENETVQHFSESQTRKSSSCNIAVLHPEFKSTRSEHSPLTRSLKQVSESLESPITDSDLKTNSTHEKNDSCSLTGSSKQVSGYSESPITDVKVGDDDRIIDPVTCPVNTTCFIADDRVSQDRTQDAQIDQTQGNRSLTSGKICVDAEEQPLESEGLPAYPRPVTRIDVIENQSLRNSKTDKTVGDVTVKPIEINQVVRRHCSKTVSDIACNLQDTDQEMGSDSDKIVRNVALEKTKMCQLKGDKPKKNVGDFSTDPIDTYRERTSKTSRSVRDAEPVESYHVMASKSMKTIGHISANPVETHELMGSNTSKTVDTKPDITQQMMAKSVVKTVTNVVTDPIEIHQEKIGKSVNDETTCLGAPTPEITFMAPNYMAIDSLRETKTAATNTDQEKQDNAALTGFIVPIITVDEASTVGDASDCSEDMDAVAIDADEYLAFIQCVQSENQSNGLEIPYNQTYNGLHQLNEHYRNVRSTLSIPCNPEISEERILSRLQETRSLHTLRPDLEYVQRYHSSAALELAGLRTTLTPSTYNVEFQSHTLFRPSSPIPVDTSPTFPHKLYQPSPKPKTSRSTPGKQKASRLSASKPSPRPSTSEYTQPGKTTNKAPEVSVSERTEVATPSSSHKCNIFRPVSNPDPGPATSDCNTSSRTSNDMQGGIVSQSTEEVLISCLVPEGSHRGSSIRSTMSSRRSSMASVGTVHWDLTLPDPSALNREVSWGGKTPESDTKHQVRRRHSTALGIQGERFLETSDHLHGILHGSTKDSHPFLSDNLRRGSAHSSRRGSAPSSRRQSVSSLNYDLGERRLSTASALSGGHSRRTSRMGSVIEEETGARGLGRQASQYDPKFEKSERYNHQRENTFNKATQWLSPVRRGLRNLQVHYSKTNTTHNDGLIFAHLLRAAHVKNTAVEEGVYAMERRLYTRRHGDNPHATTFFDTPNSSPYHHNHSASAEVGSENCARRASAGTGRKMFSTVAKKKKERNERIKKKNDELEMGYTPHALSLKQLGPEDIEAIRSQCRHLRVSPRLQQHLYNVDAELL